MTRSPLVEKIDEATKAVWPEVQAALDVVNRSALELAGLADDVAPRVEEYWSRSNGRVKRRKVCEETIWVLARLGWLRTGTERDVIAAAQAWYDCGPDTLEPEIDAVETALESAVKNLPRIEKEI